MSRIANAPVVLPKGVEAHISDGEISVKGGKGTLKLRLHDAIQIVSEGDQLKFSPTIESKDAVAQAGTARSIVSNMVKGVSERFERKLELVSVGYRAKAQGKSLN